VIFFFFAMASSATTTTVRMYVEIVAVVRMAIWAARFCRIVGSECFAAQLVNLSRYRL
jgi:hypothetical protein